MQFSSKSKECQINAESCRSVSSPQPHRISVRSVTHDRRTSRDAACTMIIGRDTAHLGPSAVRASHITCSSAVISWLPANTNHQHVVCVNNVEVRLVKPGVYRQTITGQLEPLPSFSMVTVTESASLASAAPTQAYHRVHSTESPSGRSTCARPARLHRSRRPKRPPAPTQTSERWPRGCQIHRR